MINYSGIDEAVLIHALYHAARPCDASTVAYMEGSRVTLDFVIDSMNGAANGMPLRGPTPDGRRCVDYYAGRPLKLNLDLRVKEFDARLYDRDARSGTAARVVAALRDRENHAYPVSAQGDQCWMTNYAN